jgi:hypothetical protein
MDFEDSELRGRQSGTCKSIGRKQTRGYQGVRKGGNVRVLCNGDSVCLGMKMFCKWVVVIHYDYT